MDNSEATERPTGLLRVGVLVLIAGALVFAGGSMASAVPDGTSGGPEFIVSCTGSAPETLTCTLTVSGLPDPLGERFDMVLYSAGGTDETPANSGPIYTTVSAAVLGSADNVPVLLSRNLSNVKPPPVALIPHVPTQPPRYL